MPKGRTGTKGRIVAWWLTGGEEECPHCGQLYAYEVQFRCPDCDGPCCPHCKRKLTDDRAVCPACVEASVQAEGLSRG